MKKSGEEVNAAYRAHLLLRELNLTREKAAAMTQPVPRDIADWFELVEVPSGAFLMGSTQDEVDLAVRAWSHRLVNKAYSPEMFRSWLTKEQPNHSAFVAMFQMARFPVTNRQYRAFCAATGYALPASLLRDLPGDHPVWGVDAAAIDRFLAWVREHSGLYVRLPSEAEWEWAARGSERRQYPFGDEFDARLCNTREAGRNGTTRVTEHARYASPFGICDMAGNVEEWTASNYAAYPGGRFIADHLTDALGRVYPVLRGGSAELGGDLARCARRHGPHPQFKLFGFRIALS